MPGTVEIWVEMHAQTHHNVAGLASGHYDVGLTDDGRAYATSTLRESYTDTSFDAVFASDTQRAYETACLMFADRPLSIVQDRRLRECHYGAFQAAPRAEMEAARRSAIDAPFPGGESYVQVAERMRSFLRDLAAEYAGRRVLLVGHGATLWTLEHLVNGHDLGETVRAGLLPERPWRYLLSAQRHPAIWQRRTRPRPA
jgi:broad specificity phosphatase PhoE